MACRIPFARSDRLGQPVRDDRLGSWVSGFLGPAAHVTLATPCARRVFRGNALASAETRCVSGAVSGLFRSPKELKQQAKNYVFKKKTVYSIALRHCGGTKAQEQKAGTG